MKTESWITVMGGSRDLAADDQILFPDLRRIDFLNDIFELWITVMVGSRDLAADDQMKLHFVTTSFFLAHTRNMVGTIL